MESFVVHIDRKRWADMRRNVRLGLAGSVVIGFGGGAWLTIAGIVGARQTSLVPGILLLLLGVGAAWSLLQRKHQTISASGSPVLFSLDHAGLHLDPGEGADPLERDWDAFRITWPERTGSYLEVSPADAPARRWPVLVTDAARPALAAAIAELSGGSSTLGDDSHPAPRPAR
ncbi:hypothetical protein [Raineyella fluvialis]|uniref:Uncharacterized protein n=1 Tax=Raineyella fluvialis TaxID=2662261 RepID=A0A5Q2F786_9ACTN|nr:hypothetical protein [Raineyella fluvialis]QGF22518.1 hypothetical protein Rai3103_01125 [Raineyella fluvialis]